MGKSMPCSVANSKTVVTKIVELWMQGLILKTLPKKSMMNTITDSTVLTKVRKGRGLCPRSGASRRPRDHGVAHT